MEQLKFINLHKKRSQNQPNIFKNKQTASKDEPSKSHTVLGKTPNTEQSAFLQEWESGAVKSPFCQSKLSVGGVNLL